MRISNRQSRRRDLLLRAFGLVIAGAGAIACSEVSVQPHAVQEAPTAASLSLVPTFVKMPDGGPTIQIGTISGVLTCKDDGSRTAIVANMVGGNATLNFNLEVSGSSDDFMLDIVAYDVNGAAVFSFSQPVTLKTGANTDVPPPNLVYSGPDKSVTVLRLSPRTFTLDATTTITVGAVGTDASGATIASVRVGWTSRNPLVATVDANGLVRPGTVPGSTYIVGRTASNAVDSVLVTMHGTLDHVAIAPATAAVIRGGSTTLVGTILDANGNAITDQSLTWATSDASVATVSSSGLVSGLKLGSATITASAGGKSATALVTVVSALDHIELTPTSVNFTALQQTQVLTLRLVAKQGASLTGIAATYSSTNPKVASVDATGVVTAIGNGAAVITATADDQTATMTVAVNQLAASITVSPKTASVSSLGDGALFKAVAVDANGNPIPDALPAWTSSDVSVATVAGGGTIAHKAGTATITATLNGKSDNATLNVAPIVRMLVLTSSKRSIPVGGTAIVTAKYGDANGNPLSDANPVWSTTTPSVVSVSAGIVTGLSGGTGNIVATAGAFTGAIGITVTGGGGGGGGGLTLNLSSVEKLPNGTATFFVVSGGSGPFTWTVNGIPGGNATFGTIALVEGGVSYTAPASVPSPSTFDVCANQATPPASGCVHVTISPIPSGGADVIVFNDVNTFVSPGEGDVNNRLMYANLVNFTGAGPRASQHSVLLYGGHNTAYFVNSASVMAGVMQDQGYTTNNWYDSDLTAAIDPSYKVIMLWLPTTPFSVTEINNLKEFAAEGGRIVFIGEHAGFYPVGINVENKFFLDMGAQMTNSGGAYDCGSVTEPASRLRPHEVTAGLTDLTVACASQVIPGPNDYPLLYDMSGTRVLAAVAKIDVTPLPVVVTSVRRPTLNAAKKPTVKAPDLTVPPGIDPRDPAGRPIIKP